MGVAQGGGGGHGGGVMSTGQVKVTWIKLMPVTNPNTGATVKKVFFQGYEGPEDNPSVIRKGFFDFSEADADTIRKLAKSMGSTAKRLTYDEDTGTVFRFEYTDRFQGTLGFAFEQSNIPTTTPQPTIDNVNRHFKATNFSEPA